MCLFSLYITYMHHCTSHNNKHCLHVPLPQATWIAAIIVWIFLLVPLWVSIVVTSFHRCSGSPWLALPSWSSRLGDEHSSSFALPSLGHLIYVRWHRNHHMGHVCNLLFILNIKWSLRSAIRIKIDLKLKKRVSRKKKMYLMWKRGELKKGRYELQLELGGGPITMDNFNKEDWYWHWILIGWAPFSGEYSRTTFQKESSESLLTS